MSDLTNKMSGGPERSPNSSDVPEIGFGHVAGNSRKLFAGVAALLLVISAIVLLVSGYWVGRAVHEAQPDKAQITMIDDLESRTMTYAQAEELSKQWFEQLTQVVDTQPNADLKRAVFWGGFCVNWVESAGFVFSDQWPDETHPNPFTVNYRDEAAKLYATLNQEFHQEYGIDKALSEFLPAQQQACLVI